MNHLRDRDGYVRRTRLEYSLGADRVQAFDWHLYRVAIAAGIAAKPLPRQALFLINYRGPAGTFPSYAYHRVLTGEVAPERFAGKIVLVGATSTILHDRFQTPFDELSGVEIHAKASSENK